MRNRSHIIASLLFVLANFMFFTPCASAQRLQGAIRRDDMRRAEDHEIEALEFFQDVGNGALGLVEGLFNEAKDWALHTGKKSEEAVESISVTVGFASEAVTGWTPIELEEVEGGWVVKSWLGMPNNNPQPKVVSELEILLNTLGITATACGFGFLPGECGKSAVADDVLSSLDDLAQLERLKRKPPHSPYTPKYSQPLPDFPLPPLPGDRPIPFNLPPGEVVPTEDEVNIIIRIIEPEVPLDKYPIVVDRMTGGEPLPLRPKWPMWGDEAQSFLDVWELDIKEFVKLSSKEPGTLTPVEKFILERRTEKLRDELLDDLTDIAQSLMVRYDGGGLPLLNLLNWLKRHGLGLFKNKATGEWYVDIAIQGSILPVEATSNFQPPSETTYPVDPGDENDLDIYYNEIFGLI